MKTDKLYVVYVSIFGNFADETLLMEELRKVSVKLDQQGSKLDQQGSKLDGVVRDMSLIKKKSTNNYLPLTEPSKTGDIVQHDARRMREWHGDKCCVTGLTPLSDSEEGITISHLIPQRYPDVLLQVSSSDEFQADGYDMANVRNTVCLTRWLHSMNESCLWCIVPADPTRDGEYVVRVLLPDDYDKKKLRIPAGAQPYMSYFPALISQYKNKPVSFKKDHIPSRRCMSWNAMECYKYAMKMHWITEDECEQFESFSKLSEGLSIPDSSHEDSNYNMETHRSPQAPVAFMSYSPPAGPSNQQKRRSRHHHRQ